MKGKAGGYAILAAAVFGAGFLAAPNAVVHTRDRVHVVRVPEVHIVRDTKTNVVHDPPREIDACRRIPQTAADLYDTFKKISATVSPLSDEISKARVALSDGDVTGTTPTMEALANARNDISQLNIDYQQQLELYGAMVTACQHAQK